MDLYGIYERKQDRTGIPYGLISAPPSPFGSLQNVDKGHTARRRPPLVEQTCSTVAERSEAALTPASTRARCWPDDAKSPLELTMAADVR